MIYRNEDFTYDSKTGIIRHARDKGIGGGANAAMAGDVCGPSSFSKGHRQTYYQGKRIQQHRLAWLLVYGEFPNGQIDHINGIRTDNRLVNLRVVDAVTQAMNRKKPMTNTSGVMGVHWHVMRRSKYRQGNDAKWRATIQVNHKTHVLYRGDDFFEACCQRKLAEIKYNFHPNHGRPA